MRQWYVKCAGLSFVAWKAPPYLGPVPTARTAIVTGANQNLGRSLAAGLAAGLTSSDRVLLTGRDWSRITAAARELAATLVDGARIEPRVLDVREPQAIEDLATELGQVDILFSNAAARMSPHADPAAEVDAVVDTNNLATFEVLRHFGPRMRPGGRLIVVASALGTLDKLDVEVRPRFATAAEQGLDAVVQLVEEWRASVKTGRAIEDGFGRWLNIPSKVAQVAAVRAAAAPRRAADLADDVLVMALCPGLIDTAASRPWFTDMREAQTPDQAAAWPVELALTPGFPIELHGELVQFGTVIPWESGMPVPAHAG